MYNVHFGESLTTVLDFEHSFIYFIQQMINSVPEFQAKTSTKQ